MRKYKKYVIGFDTDDAYVYGPDKLDSATCIDTMGIKEATKNLKEMIEFNAYYKHPKIVIYELVPIKEENK